MEKCRMMAPGIVALALVLLGAVNIQLQGMAEVMPLFPLIIVFYWSIYWPEVAPRWFVFLLGLFHDIIHALPPGITSLLLLVLWMILTVQRRHLLKEPFFIIWLVFAVCAAGYMALDWLAQSLYHGHFFPADVLWVRLVLSVLCYPLLHKIMNGLHKQVLQK